MLRALATVLAAICLSGLSARSDDIPTLDVNPVCHGIAMQGELEVGLQQTSFKQCVQSEQSVREDLKKEWSTFSTSDKSHCAFDPKRTWSGSGLLPCNSCPQTL